MTMSIELLPSLYCLCNVDCLVDLSDGFRLYTEQKLLSHKWLCL